MHNFLTVLRKELLDVIRDKKTIAFTILLPILIYPIMFNIMSTVMTSSIEDANKEIRIVIEGDRSSELSKLLESQQNVKLENIDEPKEALKKGDIQLIVKIPDGLDKSIEEQKAAKIEILVDDDSTKSTISAASINKIIDEYSKKIVDGRLVLLKVDSNIINPLLVEQKSGVNEDGEVNSMGSMMMGMLPALIVILLLSPTIGLAAELGAGEKEKSTFEPLLSTSSSRNSLLWGKVATIGTILCCTLIASVISLSLSLKGFIDKMSEGTESININIDIKAMALIIVFSVILILVISMMQIGISMYARSAKEANTYLSGILMPIMLMVFIPMYLDVKSMSIIFYNIPFVNTVCVMKEIIIGIYNTEHILMVLIWNLFYVGVSVFAVKRLFSKEEIVFRI